MDLETYRAKMNEVELLHAEFMTEHDRGTYYADEMGKIVKNFFTILYHFMFTGKFRKAKKKALESLARMSAIIRRQEEIYEEIVCNPLDISEEL